MTTAATAASPPTTTPTASPAPAGEDLGSSAQRERRRRILDATVALATKGGFDAVQMRAVAEQADVALGTLYRYFPSKIHLLVSALGRQFEAAEKAGRGRPVLGDTPHERVMWMLRRVTGNLQKEQHLTEALVRSFMFADSSVKDEIHHVGMLLTAMLTRAISPDADHEPTDDDVAIARVIGDVWLSALVGWVTGRASAEDLDDQMDVAVRLLLR